MSRNKIIKRAPGWVDFENRDRYRAWGVKAQSFTERGECGRSRLAQTLPEHSPLAHTPLDSWMLSGPLPSRGWRERKGALLSLPASLALCFFLPSRHCFFFFLGHTMVKQLQMPRSVYTSSVVFFFFFKSLAVQSCFRSCAFSIQWGISINISNLLLSILQIAAVTCSQS